MPVTLTVTAGPHIGKEFPFDTHDTFLVGRAKDAHLQLSGDDPYFSRRHFLIEVHPPRIRVYDLKSRNGIAVNGSKVAFADLNDGGEPSMTLVVRQLTSSGRSSATPGSTARTTCQ